MGKMGKIMLVLGSLIGLCCFSINTYAFSPSGWTNAHATFYGGSDASGTMGKPFRLNLLTLDSFILNGN